MSHPSLPSSPLVAGRGLAPQPTPPRPHPKGVPATSTAKPRAGGRDRLAVPHRARDGPACGSLSGGESYA